MSESITGTIEHVTFHNPENGFAVLRTRIAGRNGVWTVVGRTPRAVAGESLEATGEWQDDPEHGSQFRAASLNTSAPRSREAIEKYLGSGLIKGIGPVYARKIVEVFGERTLQIIDESPTFLREIRGIGPRRIQEIRESWRQQKAVRDIMLFLQEHGMGSARAVRIYKAYGDRAVEVVKANPSRLANDIWGVGFATADELARHMGLDEHSPQRAQAALRHVLKEAADHGHCAVPEATLIADTQDLTGIPDDLLRAAAGALVASKELIREDEVTPEPWLYLKRLHAAETTVAGR